MTKRIAILTYPKLCTFEFACAIELFALQRPDIEDWYNCDIISLGNKCTSSTGGFCIEADITFSPELGFSHYDKVIIPGWTGIDAEVPKKLTRALQDFYHNKGTLISFCSGAFVLAATGLLNNKDATTHWRYEESFKEQYPTINFKENVLYTLSDRLYTSAGSASALDLGISIIREDFGSTIANNIAKRLVISPHREGGQAQFSNNIEPIQENMLKGSLEWAKRNIQHNISIDQMAKKACLSRRSFDRHFRSNMGLSPKEWLIKQRIHLAKEFLESSHASIEYIAEKSGFGTPMNFRHHFTKTLGISPSHYRNSFIHIQTNAKKPD